MSVRIVQIEDAHKHTHVKWTQTQKQLHIYKHRHLHAYMEDSEARTIHTESVCLCY